MADVLSQSEVESLLAALDPGAPQSRRAGRRTDEPHAPVSHCDFQRPERFGQEHLRTLQEVHEGFSREFGAALSSLVRTTVEVKLISVDQHTYGEFVLGLENPTCFNLFQAQSLDGHVVLELNPSIVFPIIDRLLGGGQARMPNIPRRPLTEIEWRLASRITELAASTLQSAWSSLGDLELRATRVESNPQLVPIVPANEIVVVISFEISMVEMRGIMNLCIPRNIIQSLAGKLSAGARATDTRKPADHRQTQSLETGVAGAGVEMIVYLAGTKLTTGELVGLAVGDIIATRHAADDPLEVCIEGRPKFYGLAGLLGGHKAVRIGKPVVPPADVVEVKPASGEGFPPAAGPNSAL